MHAGTSWMPCQYRLVGGRVVWGSFGEDWGSEWAEWEWSRAGEVILVAVSHTRSYPPFPVWTHPPNNWCRFEDTVGNQVTFYLQGGMQIFLLAI